MMSIRIVTFSPESQIRTPRVLLRSMFADLLASRELAWRLFVRDISAQYRQSLFGVAWAFLPPILTGLVFIFLQAQRVIDLGDVDVPYPVFALSGLILWQVFVESLNAPLKTVTAAKPILAKINFPYEALILSAGYTVVFSLIFKVIILAGVFLVFQIPLTWALLLAPFGILMMVLLGLGIGLLLTPLGMLYTDVSSGLVLATQLWFFLTPVVYSPPERFPFSAVTAVNPVGRLLVATRDLVVRGALPEAQPLLVIGALTLLLVFLAWVAYRIAIPILVERISA
jgi:lipopolysaccharide transport system permease protein